MKDEDMMKLLLIVATLSSGCQHDILKLKKNLLLDWTMDPGKSQSPLTGAKAGATGWYERAAISSGSVSGQSCPTCGG